MKKNIIIIGAKGYKKNYGGWETFVTNLILNYPDKETTFYVPEITYDLDKDKKFITKDKVKCVEIYTPPRGSATMMNFVFKAVLFFKKYIKDNDLKNTVMFIVGCRVGPLFTVIKRPLHRLGVKIVINPDGLEWSRAKWNFLIKMYFHLSERTMINASDYAVCDSKEIEKYVKGKYKTPTTFIAYGSYLDKPIDSKKAKTLLRRYHIDKYYLVVGRFVPENNLELIIREFMKSNTKNSLLIITNLERNKFYDRLVKNTHFDKDERIKLVGSVYNQDELRYLRAHALGYIHGHSAGGTNPSLLEALSLTNVNILYDVPYNREVGLDNTLYFTKEDGSLKAMIEKVDDLSDDAISYLGERAKKRIKEAYTWDIVANKYNNLFDDLLKSKN